MGANRPEVSQEEIEKVCKDANIYDFITTLPQAFETDCGYCSISTGLLTNGH